MSLVSIIVPIYNVEAYVRRTIESVLNQTAHNLEIILVDDGSEDASGRICDEYAQKDSRIIVIHQKNGGLAFARNAGTNRAAGEYVLFLDGDDYLRNDAVERLLLAAEQYPSDFIQFRYREVQEGEEPPVRRTTESVEQAHTSRELFQHLYALGGVAASAATKLMRRELALELPFRRIRHEDEQWCTEAFQRNLTVTYLPDELYYYVMRKDSMIHSTFNLTKMDVFQVMRERIAMLERLQLKEFLPLEYRKMFFTILNLHCEAMEAHAEESVQNIRAEFRKNQEKMEKYMVVSGKYRVLFWAMTHHYSAVELYRRHRKRRRGSV